MNKTEMFNLLQDFLTAIICVCIPILTGYLTKILRHTADQIANDNKSDMAAFCIKEIGDAICTAVTAVNQTYVDTIKASGDPFTKDEQLKAFKKAYYIALSMLSGSTKEFIENNYGSLEGYLESKIEAEVKTQKDITIQNTE